MISLGFGKWARADRIYALEPLEGAERGHGRRTRVWVDGVPEPIVASAHRADDPRRDGPGRSGTSAGARRRARPRRAARRPRSRRGASTSAISAAARAGCSRRRRGRPRPNSSFDRTLTGTVGREFFARSVHEVAPDLIGVDAARRRSRRADRRGRGVRPGGSREPRVPRADAAERGHVRPGGLRVRLSLVRHPLVPELRVRRARSRRGGAHPCARAGARARGDARRVAASMRTVRSARGRASSARRSRSRASTTGSRSTQQPFELRRARRDAGDRDRPADRDHAGGGASVALRPRRARRSSAARCAGNADLESRLEGWRARRRSHARRRRMRSPTPSRPHAGPASTALLRVRACIRCQLARCADDRGRRRTRHVLRRRVPYASTNAASRAGASHDANAGSRSAGGRQRHPVRRRVDDVAQTRARPRQVEVDQGRRLAVAEDDVLRRDVEVADDVGAAAPEAGRPAARRRTSSPNQTRVVGGRERCRRVVQPPQQAARRRRARQSVAAQRSTTGWPGDIAGDEVEDVAPVLVDAEEARRTVESDLLQMAEVRRDRRRPRTARAAHGVADTHHALGDVAARRAVSRSRSLAPTATGLGATTSCTFMPGAAATPARGLCGDDSAGLRRLPFRRDVEADRRQELQPRELRRAPRRSVRPTILRDDAVQRLREHERHLVERREVARRRVLPQHACRCAARRRRLVDELRRQRLRRRGARARRRASSRRRSAPRPRSRVQFAVVAGPRPAEVDDERRVAAVAVVELGPAVAIRDAPVTTERYGGDAKPLGLRRRSSRERRLHERLPDLRGERAAGDRRGRGTRSASAAACSGSRPTPR